MANTKKKRGLLTPEKEVLWAKWTKLYDEKRLSQGEYLGRLYDIGFDRPEAHVVRKGDSLYYAFFAKEFDGSIELRGLASRAYRLTDYVNGRDLGVVQGPTAKVATKFEQSLLIEARPEGSGAPAAQN
jgi:alpha-galactosidase